jgi:hypothetical protein
MLHIPVSLLVAVGRVEVYVTQPEETMNDYNNIASLPSQCVASLDCYRGPTVTKVII